MISKLMRIIPSEEDLTEKVKESMLFLILADSYQPRFSVLLLFGEQLDISTFVIGRKIKYMSATCLHILRERASAARRNILIFVGNFRHRRCRNFLIPSLCKK